MSRIGVFGWGVVAPRSPNISAFAENLASAETWLTPFNGFGPDNFLVGTPKFDFADYKGWIETRFPPNRFRQLTEKMDLPTLYAAGAFVQALGQNPGIESELVELGSRAHVYVGTGLGSIGTIAENAIALDRAQRRWDRFWGERHPDLTAYRAKVEAGEGDPEVPPDPRWAAPDEREVAEATWWHYWAGRSPDLHVYLAALAGIESLAVLGEVESGKRRVMREKQRRQAQLDRHWGAPQPPWLAVSANLVWNIANTPAAQITMLGRITGLAFSPVAACSTFGVALKLAVDAIERGEATAVVVGATDPPPHPLTVGGFYRARVISADGKVSKPLSELRGTHIAGGAAVWIVADLDHMRARGFHPLGMEPLAVGVSSDADHIITPSTAGPTSAIEQAFSSSGLRPDEIATWDLHATATPGDYQEVATLRQLLPGSVLVTARKGTFGHGMSAGGGWELTAQYLGFERGRLFPTPLLRSELNPEIAARHGLFTFDQPCEISGAAAGKLSMGIGGINACVISRPWPAVSPRAPEPAG
ncbi:MAG: beta-ketoacyl synthase [Acidobacteriota bacterium]|nr:beta-ketoacyl synthase [Acidobacteriota bacterium]